MIYEREKEYSWLDQGVHLTIVLRRLQVVESRQLHIKSHDWYDPTSIHLYILALHPRQTVRLQGAFFTFTETFAKNIFFNIYLTSYSNNDDDEMLGKNKKKHLFCIRWVTCMCVGECFRENMKNKAILFMNQNTIQFFIVAVSIKEYGSKSFCVSKSVGLRETWGVS